MAQIVQSVYVGQSLDPLPRPTQVPTLPPPQKFFGGLRYFAYLFFVILLLFASSYINIVLTDKRVIIAKPKCFPTIYRSKGWS